MLWLACWNPPPQHPYTFIPSFIPQLIFLPLLLVIKTHVKMPDQRILPCGFLAKILVSLRKRIIKCENINEGTGGLVLRHKVLALLKHV